MVRVRHQHFFAMLGKRERFDSKERTKCHGLGLLVCWLPALFCSSVLYLVVTSRSPVFPAFFFPVSLHLTPLTPVVVCFEACVGSLTLCWFICFRSCVSHACPLSPCVFPAFPVCSMWFFRSVLSLFCIMFAFSFARLLDFGLRLIKAQLRGMLARGAALCCIRVAVAQTWDSYRWSRFVCRMKPSNFNPNHMISVSVLQYFILWLSDGYGNMKSATKQYTDWQMHTLMIRLLHP